MLPDIGASELIVIALVALIFVGPKDLPQMLKKLGQFTAKMRRMAADFRSSFDDMARQSELEDLRREVEQMRSQASSAMSDPIGVDATLRETVAEMNPAIEAPDDNPYIGFDSIPEPDEAAAPAKPKRKPAAKASAAKPSRAKAAPKAAPKPKAATPRKRAVSKASS